MMRLLTRFLLSLCFLWLGGYVLTCHSGIGYPLKQVIERPIHNNYTSLEYRKAQIIKTPSRSTDKGAEKTKAIEIEEDEDESVLFKKYLETGNFQTAFLNTQGPENFLLCLNPLPSCEHFSYSSSDKFIIHRVIRI
jgi:hypothetical protein